MSEGMREIYDNNPCIAAMGMDSVSRTEDGTEVINWSVDQARMLRGDSKRAARRQACQPKPFDGTRAWEEWFADFMDDMRCNRWSPEDALPELLRCLRRGPGKLAVEMWRNRFAGRGTFAQLVQCASYICGVIGKENPKEIFKKRTQKPNESHRVYGIELQTLLQKARPRTNLDDEDFISELFTQFIKGLRCEEQARIAADRWRYDTSLTDLFLAIENYDMKKHLFSGKVLTRAAAVRSCVETSSESSETSSEDDENIGAVNFKRNGKEKSKKDYKKDSKKEYKRDYSKRDFSKSEKSYRKEYTSDQSEKAVVPVTAATPTAAKATLLDQNDLMDVLVKKLTEKLNLNRRGNRPRVDKANKTCYRCQKKGHFAMECPAEKPVLREPKELKEN